MIKKILIGVALLLIYKQATNFYDKLKMSFSNWKLKFNISDLSNTNITSTLTLENPTNNTITIYGYSGKALINGSAIGDFFSNQQFTIPANGAVNNSLSARVVNAQLVANLVTALKNKVIPPVTFKGVIRSNFGNIPFTNTVNEGGEA